MKYKVLDLQNNTVYVATLKTRRIEEKQISKNYDGWTDQQISDLNEKNKPWHKCLDMRHVVYIRQSLKPMEYIPFPIEKHNLSALASDNPHLIDPKYSHYPNDIMRMINYDHFEVLETIE